MSASNRILKILSLLLTLYLSTVLINNAIISKKTQEEGEVVMGLINNMPICGKNSRIDVLLDNIVYTIKVPKGKCMRGKYQRGQNIQVKYYAPYNKVLLEEYSISNYYLSWCSLILPIYILFYLIRSNTKLE